MPLLEQRLAGPVELAVGRGAGGNGAFGRHAVALLERLVLTVAHQIARRLVGAANHEPIITLAARQQRKSNVAGCRTPPSAHTLAAELSCRRSTFDNSGRTAAYRRRSSSSWAHRAGSDTDLDDRSARGNQVTGCLSGDHVASGQRQAEARDDTT